MTPEGLANMRKANIYKNLQTVFSMIHYTMSCINKLSVAINNLLIMMNLIPLKQNYMNQRAGSIDD